MSDYLTVNRANWDERAPAHAASADYGFARFAADPAHLSDVVRFDLPLLGDVAGQRAVHLQCHIGTDTVSLSRLGARMTGLDFSGESLKQARRLATLAGAEIDYVQSDVYAARDVLDGEFDLVFTGIGALGWLPDIKRWARTVASLLAPGGRLFITAFVLDETAQGALPQRDPRLAFKREKDGPAWLVDRTAPLSAVGFDDGFFERIIQRLGLSICLKSLGHWRGQKAAHYQDIFVVEKTG